jgi:hypothetical protein
MSTPTQTLFLEKLEVDTSKIIADTDEELVMPVILTREGIVNYPEKGNMKVLRPADELKKTAFTFEHTWITEGKHPEGMLLMDPRDIIGHVANVAVDETATDALGNKSLAIRGEAHVYKNRASSNFIKNLKEGKLKEVSFGYLKDDVPEAGAWNGQTYAYVQRNIMANHLAVGVRNPRIRFPNVGVGVDEVQADIAGLQATQKALQTEIDTASKPLREKLSAVEAEIKVYEDAKKALEEDAKKKTEDTKKLLKQNVDETPATPKAPKMDVAEVLKLHRQHVKL